MKFLSTSTRVTLGLVGLSVSIWLIATALGLIPNREQAVVDGRIALSENVAVACSQFATRNDADSIAKHLESVVVRNPQVISTGVRSVDGSLIADIGNHPTHWNLPADGDSTDSQMRVPIVANNAKWGTVEVRFKELTAPGLAGPMSNPIVRLVAFIASASYLMYFIYLRKMLRHLNPAKAIPRRVRATLDALAEGLLVLDNEERILLANRSFAESLGASAEELTGRKASELPWESTGKKVDSSEYPWMRAMHDGSRQLGDLLTIDGGDQRRILKVGATPILGEDGVRRGALASFDDVTQMEKNRSELRQMLEALSQSRDEIHRQNVELERLATRDPLTSCLNRRAFFAELESLWAAATRCDQPISCIMVDLDHFKSINDTHGHSAGDMVLQKASDVLRACSREGNVVARYGGEEFCVVLPRTSLTDACHVAEQLRQAIQSTELGGLSVTASLGVSSRAMGAPDPQGMIDQADQCLYVAKREGRNCVARYDEALTRIADFERNGEANAPDTMPLHQEEAIPFHAVSALLSALAYRDSATAEHSRRVADLCVATGQGLLSVSDSFLMETAALLHDIGKIGVPDSILLKPGRLTDEEWNVMNSHERIGAELVQSTFSNPKLSKIVRTYRSWFDGNKNYPEQPSGDDIPLPARILAIADAYDAMTSKRTYRKALVPAEAFVELRRCAGKQFDPALVERFIDAASALVGGDVHEVQATKSVTLAIGTQIERLADALNTQDFEGMSVLAQRLHMTAVKYEATDIADIAQRLDTTLQSEMDEKQLVQLTGELLDLFRSTQRSYLESRASEELPLSASGGLPPVQPTG